MKRFAIPVAGAGLVLLLAAGVVAAASPAPVAPTVTPTPVVTPAPAATTGTVAAILGLTDAEVQALRQQGLSLAQIAERQKVDPQKLIDALVAQWSVRIDARLAVGALTADEAKALKDNLVLQATAMVNQVTLGGMRGAAVGAGPNGTARGMGRGGNNGAGVNGGAMNGAGAGRGGMMRGAGGGNGTCPVPTTAPSS
ncbi:MAG TPA: hypothetical protein VES19_17410 [Candidatus Limnocylindrales bacterium]|nr:hypothetical protein [Candidatus Limnocylindrales bacterium]